jgi:hypothetical protein
MAMTSETKRNLETLGISHMNLEPGGFYQGVLPGGFTCSQTQINVPGPKVEFKDDFSREIKAFHEIPEPIQIPHFKAATEKDENSGLMKEVLRDFNAMDNWRIHEALMYALQTGVIRYVPEDEMLEKYPTTFAGRNPKLVWRAKSDKPEKSMRLLLDEAEQNDSFARHASKTSAHVKAVQAAVLSGKVPPVPVK